jgi:dipeptidyl aminopeptidase/acylaminoacyl peptidase
MPSKSELANEARNHGGSKAARESGRLNLLPGRGEERTASWTDVLSGVLYEAVTQLTGAGYSVQFSVTRKGNALAVRVWSAEGSDVYYADSGDEAARLLSELVAVVTGAD